MQQAFAFNELSHIIPEKRPMLMIDRLYLDASQGQATAIKAVSMDEPFFQGHFPQNPIMPGVLQISAMAQVSGVLLRELAQAELDQYVPMLRYMRNMKFRKPVVPGDIMIVKTQKDAEDDTVFHVTTHVGNELVCQGTLGMALKERKQLRDIRKTIDLEPTDDTLEENAGHNDIHTIMQAIPHRYPFLFIDRLLGIDKENLHVVGIKNVTGNEPLFEGLSEPLLPEPIQCEVAAQTGCALALMREGYDEKFVYFMSISEAEFFHPIVPGDQVKVHMDVSAKGRYGRAEGKLAVGQQTASSISMKFAIVDKE